MLPKIEQPILETKLRSTGEVIKFRPFLVKEQKILMLSSGEESTFEEMVKACVQVVNNCTIDDINAEELTMYDLQDLFLQIRMKSVGETQEFNLICGECEKTTDFELELDDLKVIGLEDIPDNLIRIGDDIVIKMKFPSAAKIAKGDMDDIDYIAECIDVVEDEEESNRFIDVPKEEQIEFIENLPIAVADEMQEFMKAMPVLAHNVEYNCPHCGADQIVNINGYEHFFA